MEKRSCKTLKNDFTTASRAMRGQGTASHTHTFTLDYADNEETLLQNLKTRAEKYFISA